MKKNVFLIGFMACGKSTIGKDLALQLNCAFLDTDLLIEKKVKKNIKDFIIENGEIAFRIWENKIVREIIGNTEKSVVATGGGLACSQENIELLKKSGILIFIDAPEELIFKRLKGDSTRPLIANLNDAELKTFISTKLKERKEFYDQATIKIEGKKNTKEIIGEICEKLKLLSL